MMSKTSDIQYNNDNITHFLFRSMKSYIPYEKEIKLIIYEMPEALQYTFQVFWGR